MTNENLKNSTEIATAHSTGLTITAFQKIIKNNPSLKIVDPKSKKHYLLKK